MKYLMLFGDGFEDVEALATLDVLVRGKEEVVPASLMKRYDIISKCGNVLTISKLIENVSLDSFDALIIPGGPGTFKVLSKLSIVDDIIKYFVSNDKLVCAICAAPMLVGRLGFLKDKNYTVYPGCETEVIGGTYKRNEGVVQDGKFITAKSMYYSIEFGLRIYEYFHGKEAKDQLEKSLQGE